MTDKITRTIISIAGELIPELISLVSAAGGRRYYAVAVYRAGTAATELTSTIHRTREEAEAHAAAISEGRTFEVAGIITFRSRLPL